MTTARDARRTRPHAVRTLLRALPACVLGAMLAAPAPARADVAEPPSFAAVRARYAASDAVLLDRHGVELARVRVDRDARRTPWTPLATMSPQLAAALVDGEDRRFYGHHGVDWTGFAVVAIENLVRAADGRNVRGASTLTMQLAAMLDPALGSGGQRSVGQKWDQAAAALRLERTWSKPEILEAYLNLATFRGELVGIGAASTQLLGKDPSGVDRDEAALLVALLRAPSAAPRAVAQRAMPCCATRRSLPAATTWPSIASAPASCDDAAERAYGRRARRTRPHLATRFAARAGERIATTLDAGVQRAPVAALDEHLAELAGRGGVDDGAVVVIDNASGAILAYVGSSGARASARDVDGASRRASQVRH